MIRIIFITILCSLLCCGCTRRPEDPAPSTNLSESTNPSEEDFDTLGSCTSSCHPMFYSYDEFMAYCEDGTDVPVNLVPYTQIESLGTFLMFEGDLWTNDEGDDVAHYIYKLKDECDRTLGLSVFAYELVHNNEAAEEVNPGDMRSIPGGYKGYRSFITDGLEYRFKSTGALFYIYWEINGYGFSLSAPNGGFEQFEPNPGGTFVERMLCLESAPGAVEEFAKMISFPYNPEDNTSS